MSLSGATPVVRRLRRPAMILGFLLAAALACGASWAERRVDIAPVQIVENTVLYPIRGDSMDRIRDQLRDHGPWTEGYGHGRTRSNFEVRTDLESDERGCHLVGLELLLEITVTLPEWQPGPRAPDELLDQWAMSLERLVRHEQGHRQHAIDAAHQLYRSLLRIPMQDSCLRAQRKVDDQVRNAISRLRMRGMIYDERTRNGLAESRASP